jgi:hypothetical protein
MAAKDRRGIPGFFIKGAVKALLYIQENQRKTARASKGG